MTANIFAQIPLSLSYISNTITERRVRWLKHILRRPPQELKHISLLNPVLGGIIARRTNQDLNG